MAGGMGSGVTEGGEDYRRRLRELLQANSGMLMGLLEAAAGAEDQGLLRDIVDAAFFIFAGEESSLPGGREFWSRMRSNLPAQPDGAGPDGGDPSGWRAVEGFRRELDRYAAGRPDIKNALEGLDHQGPRPSPAPAAGAEGPAARVEAPPTPERPRLPRPPPGPQDRSETLPFAQLIAPSSPAPVPAPETLDGRRAGPSRPDPEVKTVEGRLAVQEEETRLARADLAKLEKKYRENLELLKEEARDRGSLQKQLDTTSAEALRAQERLQDEQQKLADTRRRLEKRERELEALEERLHAMELELVRKEEEIRMSMQHLRDEEAERRRVLEALRQEAREKAQMEHRLKRREEDLSRLEARIVEEEKRIAALKGSQAVSEEETLRKAADLRRREEEVRAAEAGMQARIEELRSEEAAIKERIAELKKRLREGEVLQAQLEKREELRAALEERYRQKEEALVQELRELERVRAGVEGRAGPRAERDGSPEPPVTGAPEEREGGPAPQRPAPLVRMLVVAPLAGDGPPPPDGGVSPDRLFPDTERKRERPRDELYKMLSKKKKPT
ncbi:MAG: hypothetical protein FJ149_08810 [Euryarchaeota archaeon]|nr:hypothetical protein [Euryarchaeota archaeon]